MFGVFQLSSNAVIDFFFSSLFPPSSVVVFFFLYEFQRYYSFLNYGSALLQTGYGVKILSPFSTFA